MSHRNDRTLAVRALARVEGEGAMHVRVRGGAVEDVRLEIYEPPRFFEAFLRGRRHTEPPDITARICGICPVAYQMSACLAIEAACGIEVTEPIADLRRLLYCGEWIESHALHIYLLHAPDFLGYTSALALAEDRRDLVERGLALKKAGNAIMELVGGRAIHPVNVRVGGFYRAPAKPEMAALAEKLRVALDQALDTVRWAAGFEFPDFHHDHEMLALVTPGQYAIDRGTVATTGGLTFAPAEFEEHVIEEQVPHSTALHARLAGRGRYLTGPTARYTLNRQWLSPVARQAADEAGLGAECRNPYRSILVRAVEVVYAVDEALRLIERYEPPAPCYRGRSAARRRRARRHRSAARRAVPPVRHRRRRSHHLGPDRAAHLAESGQHRGRPAPVRRRPAGSRRPAADLAVRAGDPQLRPVHLLRDPLPRSHA